MSHPFAPPFPQRATFRTPAHLKNVEGKPRIGAPPDETHVPHGKRRACDAPRRADRRNPCPTWETSKVRGGTTGRSTKPMSHMGNVESARRHARRIDKPHSHPAPGAPARPPRPAPPFPSPAAVNDRASTPRAAEAP